MIRGAQAKSGLATVLTASDIHAHNTFEQREAVVPRTEKLEARGPNLNFRFPAASVAKLEVQLA